MGAIMWNCECGRSFESSRSYASHCKWCSSKIHRQKSLDASAVAVAAMQEAKKSITRSCRYCGLVGSFNSILGHEHHCSSNPTSC